jgi:hypothetical protein
MQELINICQAECLHMYLHVTDIEKAYYNTKKQIREALWR